MRLGAAPTSAGAVVGAIRGAVGAAPRPTRACVLSGSRAPGRGGRRRTGITWSHGAVPRRTAPWLRGLYGTNSGYGKCQNDRMLPAQMLTLSRFCGISGRRQRCQPTGSSPTAACSCPPPGGRGQRKHRQGEKAVHLDGAGGLLRGGAAGRCQAGWLSLLPQVALRLRSAEASKTCNGFSTASCVSNTVCPPGP